MENYSSLIRSIMKVNRTELSDVCVGIETTDASYPFAFIEFEDEENLGIYYTAEDFSERFIVLNKAYIIGVKIMYQNDLELDKDEDLYMYQ